jgi:hypothetical protein
VRTSLGHPARSGVRSLPVAAGREATSARQFGATRVLWIADDTPAHLRTNVTRSRPGRSSSPKRPGTLTTDACLADTLSSLPTLNHARRHRRPVLPTRFLRSRTLRWVMLMVLSPVMLMGLFRGSAFQLHGHDDHGVHAHAVGGSDQGPLVDADHDIRHGHRHPHVPADSTSPVGVPITDHSESPEGLLVSVPDHDQLPIGRGLDLSTVWSKIAAFAVFDIFAPLWPDLDRRMGSPGGGLPCEGPPRCLCALSAGDRLVRTSRALLI